MEEFIFDPFEDLKESWFELDTDTDLTKELRKLWITKNDRHYIIDYPPKTEKDEQEEFEYKQNRKYSLVMYNVFKIKSGYFEHKDEEIEENENYEFSYYIAEERRERKWNYKDVGCRSKTYQVLGNDYSDEIIIRKRGRPTKEIKSYVPKSNQKGRPKKSKNKSKIKLQIEQDQKFIQISTRKMYKLLLKPFKLKKFKAPYKIGKIDWKKRCFTLNHLLKLRKSLNPFV